MTETLTKSNLKSKVYLNHTPRSSLLVVEINKDSTRHPIASINRLELQIIKDRLRETKDSLYKKVFSTIVSIFRFKSVISLVYFRRRSIGIEVEILDDYDDLTSRIVNAIIREYAKP